jgi:RNA-binding protein NOB1
VINPSLATDDEFYAMYELYTLSEVVAELRDEQTRQYLENLPYELTVKPAGAMVNDEDLKLVEEFAKETGDLGSLSRVDKLVIAAGVTMARQKGEYKLVKQEPPSIEEFRPKSFQNFYEEDGSASSEESDEEKAAEKPEDTGEDDGFVATAGKRRGRGKQADECLDFDTFQEVAKGKRRTDTNLFQSQKALEKLQKKHAEALKDLMDSDEEAEAAGKQGAEELSTKPQTLDGTEKDETKEAVTGDDSDEIDNEEDGGQWVTSENLHKHLGGGDQAVNLMAQHDNNLFIKRNEGDVSVGVAATEDKKPDQINYVKFVTSDMAMQNVIIQMGFQLLNLDGMRLTRVKRYKLLCVGCDLINTDTERLFCKRCGGAFLQKVSVFVNASGKLTYFKNPKRKINLRGTQYDIPKAKGGRGCVDLILREDDLKRGEYRQLANKIRR